MTIENLNLFSVLAIVITCIVGLVICPPALRFHPFAGGRTFGNTLADALHRQERRTAQKDYIIRCVTQNADGTSQYYRFTISRNGVGYRAYIDSLPRLSVPLDQMGLGCDSGRYYIAASKRSSAKETEKAARKWAEAQSAALRIDPAQSQH